MPATAGRSVILTFHGVGPHPRMLDAGEARVWLGDDQFADILDRATGDPRVRITFDDGNASDVAVALPALLARRLRASFFVVAGRVGEPGFLGESDLSELGRHGMTIGSHGMRHRSWRGISEPDLREELIEARQLLEALVHRPVTTAACPFGAYDRRTLHHLRHGGYARVFTSDEGPAKDSAWLQPRNSLHDGDTPDLIDKILAERPGEAAVRAGKRLIKRWR